MLAALVAELAAARDRLELMSAENLSVAAAFDLSYQDLTPGQQRLFRRLACIQVPTSTDTPRQPSTTPSSALPAASCRPSTTSTCSPSPPAAATAYTT